MKKQHWVWGSLLGIALTSACSGEDSGCSNDSVQCSRNGVPQKCENGHWKDQEKCASGLVCEAGTCVVEQVKCDNGGKKCSDNGVPQLCKDQAWSDQEACGDGLQCIKGACVSKDIRECAVGDLGCSVDGIPQVCQMYSWVKKAKCAEGKKCLKGSCVAENSPECENSERRCSEGGLPQVCQKERWVSLSACEGNEVCNTKTGKCGADLTCVDAECKAASAEVYTGNVCVDGYYGKECGCSSNDDCNKGFECNEFMKICVKPEETPDIGGSGICTGKNGYICDGDNYVNCINGLEDQRKDCKKTTNVGYMGETCIVVDGLASCGCFSNADCKYGYECNEDDYYCIKSSCSEDKCKSALESKYIGNICIEGDKGVLDCGCKTDSDCNAGYRCNTSVMMCIKVDEIEAGVCTDKADDEHVCAGSRMVYCQDGQPGTSLKCAEMKDDAYLGNICIEASGRCGCKTDADCRGNRYECISEWCQLKPCKPADCAAVNDDDYVGSACVIGIDDIPVCGCDSDADCKNGSCNLIVGMCSTGTGEP